MRKNYRFVAGFVLLALAFLVSTSCGGKSPVSPASSTCQDTKATNFGGPLPCTYSTIPAESYVKVLNTFPGDGATLSYEKENVTATLEYGVSQANLDEATRTGDAIFTVACLSVDGVTTVPVCYWRPAPGISGQTVHLLSLVPVGSGEGIHQTNYIVSQMWFRPKDSPASPDRIITTSVFARTFHWQ